MKRTAALAALALMAAATLLAIALAIDTFPRGLVVLACVAGAVGAAWWGLVRGGVARTVALVAAAVLLAGAAAVLIFGHDLLGNALIVAAVLASLSLARIAFALPVDLPRAPRPARPVLIYNPRSGGGKAVRFNLAEEARARGIRPVALDGENDLRTLVDEAMSSGADALAVAGGDGTQATVAAIAAEHDLPYACIPAGTRNHFALDLGVDRNDVVGALDAFVDGAERRVDLAEVNGQVFVNNVSLGVYAAAVQEEGYRDAKLRTITAAMPHWLGPSGQRLDLRFTDDGGRQHTSADVMLVSNDPYRLGRAIGSGTRPRLDAGVLGIAVAEAGNGRAPRVRSWSTPSFEITSTERIPAGIDGEAAQLESPIRFRCRPRALRVRVARNHPGVSPSASMPATPWGVVTSLAGVALRGSPR